jgi:hypothetical protein
MELLLLLLVCSGDGDAGAVGDADQDRSQHARPLPWIRHWKEELAAAGSSKR